MLILIPTLTAGGAERVVVNLLRHLDRNRFILALAVVDMTGEAFLAEVPADVEVFDLNAGRVRYALPKLFSLIRRWRPDTVMCTLGHLNLALAFLMPLLPHRIRYLARETTVVSEGLKATPHAPWWARAYRWLYPRFDHVVCQSQYMRNDLVEHFALPPQQASVINNPIDLERVRALMTQPSPLVAAMRQRQSRPGPRGLELVAVGRLAPEKGYELLLQALSALSDQPLHLTLVGDGPLREPLMAQAQELGLVDRVTFAGQQGNPFAALAAADAFVLSSRVEGFPNVVVEALACGTPVIAVPAPGGLGEILAGRPECVVADTVSALALAATIAGFRPGGRVPPDAVNRYAAPRITAQYAELFAGALAARLG